jgi:hypothetical protein
MVIYIYNRFMTRFGSVWFIVFNDIFNNISVISWRSDLMVEETGVPGENHRPVASYWQTSSHSVVLNTYSNSHLRVVEWNIYFRRMLLYCHSFQYLLFLPSVRILFFWWLCIQAKHISRDQNDPLLSTHSLMVGEQVCSIWQAETKLI